MRAPQPASIALAALLLAALPCTQADEFDFSGGHGFVEYPLRSEYGFHAVERLGVTWGGSVISRLTYANGSIREISAGSLQQIGLGVLYRARALPFSASLTLNYHYDSDRNDNNNAAFRRVPLEAMLYFDGPGRFRFGGGVRQIYWARATSTINGINKRIDFENTRGGVVEIGYQVLPYGWVYLRRVKESYRVASYTTTGSAPLLTGNAPYDGSHLGLFISYEY